MLFREYAVQTTGGTKALFRMAPRIEGVEADRPAEEHRSPGLGGESSGIEGAALKPVPGPVALGDAAFRIEPGEPAVRAHPERASASSWMPQTTSPARPSFWAKTRHSPPAVSNRLRPAFVPIQTIPPDVDVDAVDDIVADPRSGGVLEAADEALAPARRFVEAAQAASRADPEMAGSVLLDGRDDVVAEARRIPGIVKIPRPTASPVSNRFRPCCVPIQSTSGRPSSVQRALTLLFERPFGSSGSWR